MSSPSPLSQDVPAPMWHDLVPPNLPTKDLKITFEDFNLSEGLASFDFSGFVLLEEAGSSDEETLYYLDSYAASKPSGQNHYGPLFYILIKRDSIEFEDYCCPDAECQNTTMNLLRYLMLDLNLKCKWLSYSWYYDNHEYSESRRGTEVEIRNVLGHP